MRNFEEGRSSGNTANSTSSITLSSTERILQTITTSAGREVLKNESLRATQGRALISNWDAIAELAENVREELHEVLEQNATAGERKALAKLLTRPDSVDAKLADFDAKRDADKLAAKKQAQAEKLRRARETIAKAEAEAEEEATSASSHKRAAKDNPPADA